MSARGIEITAQMIEVGLDRFVHLLQAEVSSAYLVEEVFWQRQTCVTFNGRRSMSVVEPKINHKIYGVTYIIGDCSKLFG